MHVVGMSLHPETIGEESGIWRHLIDGRLRIGVGWEAGEGREWERVDPFRQEAVWRGRWASDSQCDRAIEQARQAFKSWSQTTLADRIAIVKRFAEQIQSQRSELNRWITSETGKPLWESDTETSAVIGKVQNSIESIQHRRWDGFRGGRKFELGHSLPTARCHGRIGAIQFAGSSSGSTHCARTLGGNNGGIEAK